MVARRAVVRQSDNVVTSPELEVLESTGWGH